MTQDLLTIVSQNQSIIVDLLQKNPTVLAQFVQLVKTKKASDLAAQVADLQAQQAALNAQ